MVKSEASRPGANNSKQELEQAMSNWEMWVSLADEVLNLLIAGFSVAKVIRKRNHSKK